MSNYSGTQWMLTGREEGSGEGLGCRAKGGAV